MADLPGFLVDNGIGPNRKLRRLSVPERWCAVAGVWAIASMSPTRGYLLISDGVTATEEDFADQAGVPIAVARSCVEKMRQLGMLEMDPEMGVEHVHDWHKHQPEASRRPSDSREAWRERKARQRAAARDRAGDVTDVPRDVTPQTGDVTRGREVEGKERQQPPRPPASGGRRSRRPSSLDSNSALFKPSLAPPVPPSGKRLSDHAGYRRDLAAWQEWAASPAGQPNDDDAALVAAVVEHARTIGLPPSRVADVFEPLHAHLSDETLLIGLGATLRWNAERHTREITEALPPGTRWQLVECGCTTRLEAVA